MPRDDADGYPVDLEVEDPTERDELNLVAACTWRGDCPAREHIHGCPRALVDALLPRYTTGLIEVATTLADPERT